MKKEKVKQKTQTIEDWIKKGNKIEVIPEGQSGNPEPKIKRSWGKKQKGEKCSK